MNDGYYPTEHEWRVLRMAAGELPWQKGSWVNACVEFLSGSGYITRTGELTERGAFALDERKLQGLLSE